MDWTDIASIVFVCVTMNHLGLIRAIEKAIGKELPIVNCPKCATWWLTVWYCCFCCVETATHSFLTVLAVSFLASYVAIWVELFEGYVDTLYLNLYDKIYTASADTPASGPDESNSGGTVSELQ